jgi:hypothetical protein
VSNSDLVQAALNDAFVEIPALSYPFSRHHHTVDGSRDIGKCNGSQGVDVRPYAGIVPSVCMYVYVYVCMYVFVYVFMCVCSFMYVCMRLCVLYM